MGWGSTLMKNETLFMILDGALLMLACGALTIFHPAVWFPFMSKRGRNTEQQHTELETGPAKGSTQSATPIAHKG